VAENVGQGQNTGVGAFSVSTAGTLVLGQGTLLNARLVWFDRGGKPIRTVGEDARLNSFALSRDERRLALGVTFSAALDTDIWVRSLPDGSASKLTFGPAPGWFLPVWSPDGAEVVYATMDLAGQATYELRRKRADMTGKEETLLQAPGYLRPWDWSADGKWLVYTDGKNDLWSLPMVGDRTPTPLTQTPEDEPYGQLSADGRWLAYAAGDRANPQVYVQPVPATGAKWLVSAGSGSQPRWRRDGKELYYRRADGQLMAVSIAGASAALEHGAPQPLFGGVPGFGNVDRFTYQPSADGQRFLVVAAAESTVAPLTVVLNWQGAKRAR
jgi:Tol biopolymer transport system component